MILFPSDDREINALSESVRLGAGIVWREWFAWYPVELLDGGFAWLQRVEWTRYEDRRINAISFARVSYRLVGSDKVSPEMAWDLGVAKRPPPPAPIKQ